MKRIIDFIMYSMIIILVGSKLKKETEMQLLPNAPRGFWWHVKNSLRRNK